MLVFLSLLFCASALALVIGLIKPRLVVPGKNPTRWKALGLWSLILFVILLAVPKQPQTPPQETAAIQPDAPAAPEPAPAPAETSAPAAQASQVAPTAAAPDLGMTPEQLTLRINAENQKANTGRLLGVVRKTPGAVNDVSQYPYGPNTVCSIRSDKRTGRALDVTLIGSDADVATAFGCLVAVLSPELSLKEVDRLTREMGFAKGKGVPEKGQAIRGGVRYWVQFSPQMGVWLGAEPAAAKQ